MEGANLGATRRKLGGWMFAVCGLLSIGGQANASVKSEIAFHRGIVAFGNGELQKARTAFETVLAEDPDDTSAIHYLGLIASKEGAPERAVELYRRALAIDPDDLDARFDLGAALLEAGQTDAARRELDAVLAASPDNANARLFAGIAAYRASAYADALPHLDRALELDPELRAQARYYTGLCQAHLQDFPAAAGAFADAQQSPIQPLAASARNLGGQVTASLEEERRWSLGLTAGLEYDSNPTLAGQTLNQRDTGRGVYRISSGLDVWEDGRYSVTAGYDAYFSTNFRETFVDLMTHTANLTGVANFDPIRLALRYDFAYTWINTSDRFRSLNRLTPSVSYREGNWGRSQAYFIWQHQDFHFSIPPGFQAIDRDGERYAVGFNQFFFVRERLPSYLPVDYVRIGAAGEFQDTEGTEFRYDAWEFNFGLGIELPFQMPLTIFYRLNDFGYRDASIFATAPTDSPGEKQDALYNRLTFELDFTQPLMRGLESLGLVSERSRSILENFQVTAAGSFEFNDSDVALYDYNRKVVGTYLTYRF